VAAIYQRAASVPYERQALVAGGLPGGDKKGTLAQAGIDPRALPDRQCGHCLCSVPRPTLVGHPIGLSPGLEAAAPTIDDPEPHVPRSFDGVVLADDLGHFSDTDYVVLAAAAAYEGGPGERSTSLW
jgi:hypothetical protein